MLSNMRYWFPRESVLKKRLSYKTATSIIDHKTVLREHNLLGFLKSVQL